MLLLGANSSLSELTPLKGKQQWKCQSSFPCVTIHLETSTLSRAPPTCQYANPDTYGTITTLPVLGMDKCEISQEPPLIPLLTMNITKNVCYQASSPYVFFPFCPWISNSRDTFVVNNGLSDILSVRLDIYILRLFNRTI